MKIFMRGRESKMVYLLFLLFLKDTMALEARGMITSPGYPGQYPNNNNSTWIINAPDGASELLIKIHDQDIEYTQGFACTDYLKIEEVSDNGNYILYRQCGKGSISQIRAKGNKIKVSFISDNSKTGKGFNLTWSVSEYKHGSATSKSTKFTFTNILKLSSKDPVVSSTHEQIRRSSFSTRSSPTLTEGTWTTFPYSHMTNLSQQFQIWSTQSRGILTNRHHATLLKQTSKRTGNSTILSMLIRASSPKSKDETTSIQNVHLLTTEIAKNNISVNQNGSSTQFIKFKTSSVHQTGSPLLDSIHSSEVLHVSTTESLSVNSEQFTKRSGSTLDTSEQASTANNSHVEDFLNFSSTKPVDVDDSNRLLITNENNNTDKFPSTETILLKSTLQILVQDPISIDALNGLSLTFLCIIGFLILLVASLILFIAVQQNKIKRLKRVPGAERLTTRERYSTVLDLVDRNQESHPYLHLKQSHITGSKTNKLPNDYVYSYFEECKRDGKPPNVVHLQDKATRRTFVPEDLTELQEKAEYIEILPDRISYCQDTTTFGGKYSDPVYAQTSKKRDDTIVDKETKSDEKGLKPGSSNAHDRTPPVITRIFLENDDEFLGLAIGSKSGNVSDSDSKNSMAEECSNNVYEDLPF